MILMTSMNKSVFIPCSALTFMSELEGAK